MNYRSRFFLVAAALTVLTAPASAQYRDKKAQEEEPSEAQQLITQIGESDSTVTITLEQALEIALSENVSVKVADMDIKRAEYAKKGTYASLFPQVDISGTYQRTIKKQVMYMDFDMGSLGGGAGTGSGDGTGDGIGDGTVDGTGDGTGAGSGAAAGGGMKDGLEVGRWNTWAAGVSAAMPIVNAQLWKSIKLSALDVELAVEKARSSRLDMVTQVKNAYYSVLLAKEAFNVYKEVYENAVANFTNIEKKFNAQKASQMEYLRAKTTVSNAIPNVYNAESSVILALWQLKAVLGVDLDMNLDVAGSLDDYSQTMFRDIHSVDSLDLANNTTMRQLEIQVEQLAQNIKLQQMACVPTLSLAFNFSYNAMTNDFNFKEYRWTPYSYVGVSLNIPVFSGLKRHNNIRQAKVQHGELVLQQTDTERQLKIAMKNYLVKMETSMKSYYASEDAVSTARQSYDIVNRSYELGRSTLTDLNDAQLAVVQSELAKSQAVYEFLSAKSQLEQLLGTDEAE